MFLPLYSESEMRVWPFATIALIVINIVCFFIQHQLPSRLSKINVDLENAPPAFREELENALDEDGNISVMAPGYYPYMLHHGDGLHPLQWLTSFFVHADIFHLLGNMIFLWVFGQVVEGVVCHGLFVILYLAMGVAQNILQQLLYLWSDGGAALGASGAIYSIMLLAAWYAPQDNIQCLLVFFYRAFFIPIPVLMMALFYFLFDLAHSAHSGFEMSTPLLHSLGGLVGLVVGFVSLQSGLVDNNDRDALSMLRDIGGVKPKEKKKARTPEQMAAAEVQRQKQLEQIRVSENSLLMHLSAGNLEASLAQYHRVRRLNPRFEWSEIQLRQLINLAQNNSDWNHAVTLSQQYVERFEKEKPETATIVSLNLASILLQKLKAPSRARRALRSLNLHNLSPDQTKLLQRLVKECQRQIEDGELELADE